MGDLVRCTGCQLLHTRRPDGRCPRCGASTGAPGPEPAEPLPTLLVQPAEPALAVPPPVTLAARAPRVWTVFLAYLLAMAASLGIAVIVMVAMATRFSMRTGRRIDPVALQTLIADPGVFLAILGLGAVTNAALALAAGGMAREPWRARLALAPPRRAAAGVALACAGALGLALGFDALTSALRVRPSGTLELIRHALSAGAGRGSHATALFLVGLVVMAVLAPVGEELLFRGYMQRRLVQRWGTAAGVLVTAGLFGLAHLDKLQSPFAMVLGVLLGWITVRADSILPALVAHATVNGWAVFATRLALSPRTPASCAVVGSLGLVLVVAAVWLVRARLGAAVRAGAGAAPGAPPASISPA